ncbi:MAG: sugar phosphate isomerase/epimerase family protein [Anaerolineae bacterium]
MQIVISALHFSWDSLPDCLARAKSWGLAGVELSWHSAFARPHCTRADLDDLAAAAPEPGHLRSAHLWEDPAALDLPEALAAIQSWLAVCRRTGTTQLVLHGGSYADQHSGLARLNRFLGAVLPLCVEAGVVLNLENHYSFTYHDGHELLSEPWEFALLPEHPQLRWCFDTGHANMTRNTRELLAVMGPRLNYIHLADNLGVNDDHLAFRKGTVDWDLVFDTLKANAFDGIICVEYPVWEDKQPLRACLAEIAKRWPETGSRPAAGA